MIKINLANTLISKSDDSKSVSPSNARDIALKVILILIPVIGIYIYEKVDLDTKNKTLLSLTANQEEITGQLAASGSVSDIVTQKKELERESEEKKKVMKTIFGFRSQKILALTLLQDNLPPSCWFRKINVLEKKISVYGLSNDIQAAQAYVGSLASHAQVFSNTSGQDFSEDKTGTSNKPLYKFEFVLDLKE